MSVRSATLQVGISWILRVGVALSVLFEASGLLLDYLQTGSTSLEFANQSIWRVQGGNFFDFAFATARSAFSGLTSVELVSLGIITLMFTPYFRIIAALVYYGVEKDWKYVAITFFVFSVLTAALVVF